MGLFLTGNLGHKKANMDFGKEGQEAVLNSMKTNSTVVNISVSSNLFFFSPDLFILINWTTVSNFGDVEGFRSRFDTFCQRNAQFQEIRQIIQREFVGHRLGTKHSDAEVHFELPGHQKAGSMKRKAEQTESGEITKKRRLLWIELIDA